MIVGIGLDLCPVERGEKMTENERFMQRVFTPGERAYIAGKGAQAAQSAAGIFAAKEAMLKALGTGLTGVPLCEAEVTHTALGAPQAALSGNARARLLALGGKRMHITITHDGGMAAAFAVAEGE